MRGDSKVADILRGCRERAGLTQSELASRIYVDRTVIAKVETGAINPSYVLVRDWGQATNSADIISMDIAGHKADVGLKKQRQMEDALKTMKATLSAISFMRIKKTGR